MLTCNENHQYFLNDKPIPGYSEIVKDLGIVDLSAVPQGLLEEKAEIGTNIHEMLEMLDLGTLDEWTIPDYLEGHLKAYRAFLSEYKPIVEAVEKMVCAYPIDFPEMPYACRIDRCYLIGEDRYIVDIKSGAKTKAVRLQTAAGICAYNNGEGGQATKRGALYLSSNGTYHFDRHTEESDITVWMGCVMAFWFKYPNYKEAKK